MSENDLPGGNDAMKGNEALGENEMLGGNKAQEENEAVKGNEALGGKEPQSEKGREIRHVEPVIRKDRQLKYTGTILKIYEDRVVANGHEALWDFIHHDGAAAVLPVADDGRILMVRQYRNALNRETLEIPAGKVDDPNEPRIECAYRELEEETGYRCEHLEYLMSMNTTVAFCDEFIDIFVARNLIPSHQHLDEDEVIYVEPWSLEELEELIYTGQMTDAKTVAAIMTYARKYRR